MSWTTMGMVVVVVMVVVKSKEVMEVLIHWKLLVSSFLNVFP